jgi:asparagine synthase (glutamine-hydrolysing)
MNRLAGLVGVSPSEAARRTREMLAAVGEQGPDTAQEGGVTVTLAGTLFQPAGGASELLRLYRSRGLDAALRELNGDFSFAIADENAGALHLARDRFGVRPLYYWSAGGKLAFASRLRSLLALPNVPRDIDRTFAGLFAGSHYRTFDNDPERSPFAAIRQLPAAHALTWKDGKTSLQRYWRLEAEVDLQWSEQEIAERYRELLLDAVRIRLARLPQAAFALSGGMDSSSVLACAVRLRGARQHAFSTVYRDPTFDESEDIRPILDATVEKWHAVQVNDPDVHRLVREMVAAHDEPVATATWLAHYVMCAEVKGQGFSAIFGGLGGDELNAGEYEHFFYFFADLRSRGLESRLGREVEMWSRYHDHPIYRKSRETMERDLARLTDPAVPGRCLPDRARIERYATAVDPAFFDVRGFAPAMEQPFSSYLKNRTWQDLSRETIPCCLRAEDRQSAAFGLVNVAPFFDHRLAEFMFRVPPPLKYRDGVTKHMLRAAMAGVLPEPTRTRVKKTGWNAPAHQWFAGKGSEALRDLVRSQRFRSRGIYRIGEVERLIAEHEDVVRRGVAQENHMMFFWQLVNLAAWLDWIDELPRVQ